MSLRCHVFAEQDESFFLKQIPDFSPTCDGVTFSYGMDIPDDIDILIVYARASYSLPTRLPKERTIFIASEPDVIHPYSAAFLNQFGIVFTSSEKALSTHKIHGSICSIPFVGVNFMNSDELLNITHFAEMPCPPKDNRISVVTSSKASTEFHQKRLAFLEQLKVKIPDHLEIYGRGFKSIGDKKDALLGHKYHLALENGGGRFTWTEKLADPLLCYALPFYHGCENYHEDLPGDAAVPVTLDNVDEVINIMMAAQKENLWEKRLPAIEQARELILTEFNLVKRMAKLAKQAASTAIASPYPSKKRLIRSERSLWPEPGCRGSIPQYLTRSALLTIWPEAELKASVLHRKIKERRYAKRKQKIAEIEAAKAEKF